MLKILINSNSGGKIMKNKIKISTYLNDSNPTYVDLFMGDVGDEKRFLDLYTIIYTSSKDEAFEFK